MSGPKLLLDANVLFPTILRELLLGLAATGAYQPLWSPRILEEWARATRKLGEGAEEIARGEIALLKANWPRASVEIDEDSVTELALPDPDDRHVLAAAIAGGAEAIITRNAQDFPTRTLARYGILRRDPDGFLLEHAELPAFGDVLEEVQARAQAAAGATLALRPLLKRAKLPRLAKAMSLLQTGG